MRTLIIHDNAGYIISIESGYPLPREPVGVPFLWADVPEGKRPKPVGEIGVDVTVTPHQAILENIPPTEIDKLRNDLDSAILELSMAIAMQGGGQ